MSEENRNRPGHPALRNRFRRTGQAVRLNIIGLTRHEFSNEIIKALKKTYPNRYFGPDLTIQEAVIRVEKECPPFPEIKHFWNLFQTSQASNNA